MSAITADSDVGKQLVDVIKQKISTLGLEDDLNDVAQYIVVMVGNSKPVTELTAELCGIFGDKFTDDFGRWVYQQLEQIQNGDKETATSSSSPPNREPQSGFGGYVSSTVPRGPAALKSRIHPNNQSGVSKGPRRMLGGHSVGAASGTGKNNENRDRRNLGNFKSQLQQDVMMGEDPNGRGEGNNLELGGDGQPVQRQRGNRCRHWPNCNYPGCKFAHPRKPCNAFPNCANPKGTCNFLHVGEDPVVGPNGVVMPPNSQWMNGMLVPPPPMNNMNNMNNNRGFKNGFQPPQQPSQPTISLCKFTDKCANPQCAFGHPTPMNKDAKVQIMEWCPQDLECDDSECQYCHKSGSNVRAPEPIPQHVAQDCKFGDQCTKPNCRFRHPRSPIRCRNGPDCERVDCLFTHEKKESCKLGINCRNPKCLFQHPPERDEALKHGGTTNTWVNPGNDGSSTSDRQFASDDAEKMVISSEAG